MKRSRRQNVTQLESAGLYVRVSLDRSAHGMQDEILSPETQEDRARAYCQAQAWTVAAVERDIDESAYRQHYSHREGLMRLLEAVERGELTKIVVWKFSRLSRRLKEFIEICDRVEAAGGGVVSITEACDTGTSAGRLIRNILASFAQFQSEEISEQIFETWMTKAKRGERPGGLAPFGTINKKGLLEPDPDTHPHLVAMYQTFRETESIKAVWDYFAAHHVAAPLAAEWNLNTIRGILTNPVYVGRLDWAGETFQGKWDPLVPESLWNEVQALLGARRSTPGKRKDARLLTGFAICSLCGRPLWTRYTKRQRDGVAELRRFYWCCSPANNRKGCDLPMLDAEEFESTTMQSILTVIRSVDLEQLAATIAERRVVSTDGPDPARRRHQLQAEKERVEAQAAQLFDLLGAGDISREQFRQQNQRYLERLQLIQRELAQLTVVPAGPDPIGVRSAVQLAEHAVTEEQRRRVLSGLGVRIHVEPTRVTMNVLGLDVPLRARRIGDTVHFGEEYHRLDCQGSMLTDKQVAFIRRCYAWADKKKLAARLGRQYSTLVFVAQKLRQKGLLGS